MKAGLDIS